MTSKRSPEFRKLMGQREMDDDGFTYRYGAHKGGFVKKPRHTEANKRHVRHDKHSINMAETRRELKEAWKE